MSQLYTCYSPSGEKFELSRANFLDCTLHYGFTTNAPGAPAAPIPAPVEAPAPVESSAPEEIIEDEDGEDAALDEDGEDADYADFANEVDEAEPLTFADKDAVKAFLRDRHIEFDGRASFDTLVALASNVPA